MAVHLHYVSLVPATVQGKEEDLQEAPTLADYGPAAFLAPSTAYRCGVCGV